MILVDWVTQPHSGTPPRRKSLISGTKLAKFQPRDL